jgi:hypothetical protein
MTSGPIPSAGIAAIEYSRMFLPRGFRAFEGLDAACGGGRREAIASRLYKKLI